MKTAVINNREALVQGQMPHKGNALGGSLMVGAVVTLVPGLNLVDSSDLAQLRKNPQFELNFTTKIPPSLALEQNPEKVGKPILEVVMVASKDGKGEKALEVEDKFPLQKLPPEICKTVIADTLVEGTLRLWSREEIRPEVRYEIELQLGRITDAPAGPAAVGR